METDVLTPLESTEGLGSELCIPGKVMRKDARMITSLRRRDRGWRMPLPLRDKVIARLETILDTTTNDRNALAACKVFASLDMVNVNRERMTQQDEQGPAVHNTQINLYGGQVINAAVLVGMAPDERERAIQSGAQLSADAIASLTSDEVQRLTRAASQART